MLSGNNDNNNYQTTYHIQTYFNLLHVQVRHVNTMYEKDSF